MGLIKTGLKAAVAVKVGHAVHDRIQRRQHAEWAARGHPAAMPATGDHPGGTAAPAATPQAATPAAAPPAGDMLALLAQLGELKAAGILTEAEFETQKARILNG
jgi:Short C-terminal domain